MALPYTKTLTSATAEGENPPAGAKAGATEPVRELVPYGRESLTAGESTHVDRTVEARARAMVAADAPVMDGAQASAVRALEPPRSFEESIADPLSHAQVPGFSAAMVMRVRFAGGELPLWSLVAPLIAVAALAAAFAASAVSRAPAPALAASEVSEAVPAVSGAQTAPAGSAAQSKRALAAEASAAPAGSAGEPSGFDFPPGKYVSRDVLTAAKRRAQREVAAAQNLVAALDRDPGLVEETKTLGELRRLADNPETARIVLEAIAALPAAFSTDLLYEVWTGTAQKNEATELARALLYSRDVRPKASAALSVALDLRVAQNCVENQAILPRAERDGDRRSLHLLLQLQRRYGCGPNRRLDCNACLRGSDAVDNAVKAVRDRREPRLLGRR